MLFMTKYGLIWYHVCKRDGRRADHFDRHLFHSAFDTMVQHMRHLLGMYWFSVCGF